MKTLLVILLVAAVFAQQELVSDLPQVELKNDALDFLKGFLEGIGEKGDINKLLQCLKDLEHIFSMIKEALHDLKNMKLPDIIKGITLLIEAVKEFMTMMKPCAEGFETMKKLIAAIAHPDIRKIAMHIIMHPGEFIKHITGAIGCFEKKDYHCAGSNVGGLLKLMFLNREASNDAIEFLKGFLEGIGQGGDINKLLECLKDMEQIFAKLKEALEHLKHMNIQEIMQGVTLLIEAVREFMEILKPCSEGFDVIKKLINAITHIDIKKIAMHVLMHFKEIFSDVTTAISCFSSHDYHCAGKAVGGLLKSLLLDREENDGNELLDFLTGFIEGIGDKGDPNKLLQCLKNGEAIFAKIIEALNHLKAMKLEEVIKGLTLLVEAVRELLATLQPCMDGFEQLKRLANALAHPDIKKIAMKVIMHPGDFIKDVVGAIESFMKKDYHKFGFNLGRLLHLLFL